MIIELARGVWDLRAEKSVAMNALRFDSRAGAVNKHLHLLCVRPKDADCQIVAHPVRPEDAERFRMRSREERVQLIRRQSNNFEALHLVPRLLRTCRRQKLILLHVHAPTPARNRAHPPELSMSMSK